MANRKDPFYSENRETKKKTEAKIFHYSRDMTKTVTHRK
jgi:hypothetical protein